MLTITLFTPFVVMVMVTILHPDEVTPCASMAKVGPTVVKSAGAIISDSIADTASAAARSVAKSMAKFSKSTSHLTRNFADDAADTFQDVAKAAGKSKNLLTKSKSTAHLAQPKNIKATMIRWKKQNAILRAEEWFDWDNILATSRNVRGLWNQGASHPGFLYINRIPKPKATIRVDHILKSSTRMRSLWHRSKFTPRIMTRAAAAFRRVSPETISIAPLARGKSIRNRLFLGPQFQKFKANFKRAPLKELCYQVVRYSNWCKEKPMQAVAFTSAVVGSISATSMLLLHASSNEVERKLYEESDIISDLTDSFDYSEEDFVLARQLEIYSRTSVTFTVAYILHVLKEKLDLNLIHTAQVTDVDKMLKLLADIPAEKIDGLTVNSLFEAMGNLTAVAEMAHSEAILAATNLENIQNYPSIIEDDLMRNVTLKALHQKVLPPVTYFLDILEELPDQQTYLQTQLNNVANVLVENNDATNLAGRSYRTED